MILMTMASPKFHGTRLGHMSIYMRGNLGWENNVKKTQPCSYAILEGIVSHSNFEEDARN